MRDRQKCIDCGTLSPETETNYTLISSQFGWRLTRTRAPDGSFDIEWRCPTCWKEHKRQKIAAEEARLAARSSSIPPPDVHTISSRPLPSFPSEPPTAVNAPATPRMAPRPEPPRPLERPPTPARRIRNR